MWLCLVRILSYKCEWKVESFSVFTLLYLCRFTVVHLSICVVFLNGAHFIWLRSNRKLAIYKYTSFSLWFHSSLRVTALGTPDKRGVCGLQNWSYIAWVAGLVSLTLDADFRYRHEIEWILESCISNFLVRYDSFSFN